jgi:hypothetical protein
MPTLCWNALARAHDNRTCLPALEKGLTFNPAINLLAGHSMRRSLQLLFTGLALLAARRAAAQQNPPSPSDQTARVVAGEEYDVGGVTRTLFGNGWRNVWTAPVVIPVFDMSKFAGGVKPTERGGGNQTVSLRFKENNGWREYHFRSVNKDPVSLAMPKAIRGTMLGDIIQDLTSSLYPAGGVMVPPLLQAIGVLHVTPSIYVMPDDPRLGEFRGTFAGMLGTVELSPQEAPDDNPGFANSRKVVSGEDFMELVEKSKDVRLDEREFFAARLVDFLINDNDRTEDNIRFARYGEKGSYTWRPVPRDRDRAFTDARGWLVSFVVRSFYPKVIPFGDKYSLAGLTFESYNLDRRLLQRLTRNDAAAIGQRVQASLTDGVIDNAISQLPAEWRRTSGDRLRQTLRSRRNGLAAFGLEFYDWLATEVDVHGTDEKETVVITRLDDGRVAVTFRDNYFARTFVPGETNEVRVYLHGGNDSAVVNGAANGEIRVRVIGGGDDDVMIESAGSGATSFYDDKGKNQFATRRADVSEKEWKTPRQGNGFRFDAPWRPDWGSTLMWGPTIDFGQGAGVIIGFGPRYQSQGFRRLPHKLKAGGNLLFGVGNRQPGVNAYADYRMENSPMMLTLDARATKFENFRFHGFGNDVDKVRTSLSEVEQDVISIEPMVGWQIGWRSHEDLPSGFSDDTAGKSHALRPTVGVIEAGPVLYWNKLHPSRGSPLSDPSLSGDEAFGRAGLRAALELEKTSAGAPPDRGWTLKAEAEGFPAMWDVEESFATAAGYVATYLPLPGDGTHLALRVGGETATGSVPLLHAPAIGGRRTLRGYGFQRYRGESSSYGSAEVRIPVGVVPFFVKWNAGVFGLADAGRVWFDDRSDGGWHTSVGGGLWFSALGQTFSAAYAYGENHRFYVQKGLSF